METMFEYKVGKAFDRTMDDFRELSFKEQIDVLIESGILDDNTIIELAEDHWIEIKKYLED